jgi:hypothetical protein
MQVQEVANEKSVGPVGIVQGLPEQTGAGPRGGLGALPGARHMLLEP